MMQPRHTIAISVAVSLLVTLYSALSANGLDKSRRMNQRISALSADNIVVQRRINTLSRDIQILSGDSPESLHAIEAIARTELHLIRNDEVLLLLDPAKR